MISTGIAQQTGQNTGVQNTGLCSATDPRVVNYYEHVSDLVIQSLAISVILQDRSTTMTTCPYSLVIPILEHESITGIGLARSDAWLFI